MPAQIVRSGLRGLGWSKRPNCLPLHALEFFAFAPRLRYDQWLSDSASDFFKLCI